MTLDHLVLEVRDVDASLAFYESVFGFKPVRLKEFRGGQVPFPSLRVSPACLLDLFPKRMWRHKTPSNPHHFCFDLGRAEFAKFEKRLKRLGIRIVDTDDHNYGAKGFGYSHYILDPDGNRVEARYYP